MKIFEKNIAPIASEDDRANWTIFDILGILLCWIGIIIVYAIISAVLIDSEIIAHRIGSYVSTLSGIFIPILWIRKKYNLYKQALGLRRGILSLPAIIIVGVLPAIIYCILVRLSPVWENESALAGLELSEQYINLMLFPITIVGFTMVVLTPISEEIIVRGLLYGYLRNKCGVFLGLFIQALLFSFLHIIFLPNIGSNAWLFSLFSSCIVGIFLGVLYEKSKSLYPAIICHGTINYFFIVLSVGNSG